MKLREAENRILNGTIAGLRLIVPDDGRCGRQGISGPMILKCLSGDGAWMAKDSQSIAVYFVPAYDIMDWELSIDNAGILMDGDKVLIEGAATRTKKGTVTHVKEGDGSPYPVVVQFDDGSTGQFKRSEILAVIMEGKEDEEGN